MNAFMRVIRCEHIRREVNLVQTQIMKLASDINQIEIKKELEAMKER